MKTSKQILVVRKDLNMRKGKIASQCAHASMKAILDYMVDDTTYNSPMQEKEIKVKHLWLDKGTPIEDWINGRFTKICVSVDSEAELLEVYNNAKSVGLICALITDAGLTEFNGVPTKTCCAIGPAWSDEVDKITGHLKLL